MHKLKTFRKKRFQISKHTLPCEGAVLSKTLCNRLSHEQLKLSNDLTAITTRLTSVYKDFLKKSFFMKETLGRLVASTERLTLGFDRRLSVTWSF